MNVKAVSIIREPDDRGRASRPQDPPSRLLPRLAKVRISLGSVTVGPDELGIYLVFRGDPAEVVELLETAAELARQELPAGRYEDKRGRPQG